MQDKLQRLIVGGGANDTAAITRAAVLAELKLSLTAAAQPIKKEAIKPLGQRSEWYSLNVPSNGSAALLTAGSALGLLRGLTTFEQLWYGGVHPESPVYSYQAPIVIANDTPAFVSAAFLHSLSYVFVLFCEDD